jgi:hypothetical protein
MKSRVRVAAFAAGVIVAVVGCHTVPPPPPPPPPAEMPEPTCASVATLTYDPANTTSPLTLSAKPITVNYPAQNASQWAVCWYLVVRGNDPDPFDQMKLEGVGSLTGRGGRSVLMGDQNFRGRGFVKASFNDEPIWPTTGPQQVKVTYFVVGRLRGATTDLAVDPEIIIKR